MKLIEFLTYSPTIKTLDLTNLLRYSFIRLRFGPRREGRLKRGIQTHTPFEKGKLAERPGRKATGLPDDLPRRLMSAGLPKEELKRGHKLARSSSKGVPQKDLLFNPRGPSRTKAPRPSPFFHTLQSALQVGSTPSDMSELKQDRRVQELLVTEIFHSLQGETSLSGLRFAFIRLTGCNLRCTYCDSAYAFKGGTKKTISEILDTIRPWSVQHVLLTGGEPLLQRLSPLLVRELVALGYQVSIETHGETLPEAIRSVRDHARIVMDIKTPSSGMSRGGWRKNLESLNPHLDEIKFVIASPEDYFFARDIIRNELTDEKGQPRYSKEILLSPVVVTRGAPGKFPGVDSTWLAEQLIADQLPCRLQMQLHKILWGADKTGV